MQKFNPDVSLKGFLTWVRAQEPFTTYNYFHLNDCIVARYVKSQGYPEAWHNGTSVHLGSQEVPVSKEVNRVAEGPGGDLSVYSYGDILKYAKDLYPEA